MSTIKHLFWNRDEARLRAGWRILLYSALWFFLGYAAIYLRDTVSAGRLSEVYRTPLLAAIFTLLVVVLLTGVVGSLLLDRRPLADYGFHLNKGWWLDLGIGMALGTLLMLGFFGVELALGWTEITATFATGDSGQRFGPLILALFTTCPENTAVDSFSARWARSWGAAKYPAQEQAEAQSGSRAKRARATRATAATLASGRESAIVPPSYAIHRTF